MPYWPGVRVREAAAVRVHRERAAGAELAVLDERAAFALGAEAEVLEVQQRGDRERVVAHEQVDVGRLDAGHRERGGPETAPPVVVRSGISLIIECVPHVAAPSTYAGGFGRSRARSADVITNAPAPSVTRQQSSRCSGETCIGDASTSSIVIGSR